MTFKEQAQTGVRQKSILGALRNPVFINKITLYLCCEIKIYILNYNFGNSFAVQKRREFSYVSVRQTQCHVLEIITAFFRQKKSYPGPLSELALLTIGVSSKELMGRVQ